MSSSDKKQRGRRPALSMEDAALVRDLYKGTAAQPPDLARRFRVSEPTIHNVLARRGPYAEVPHTDCPQCGNDWIVGDSDAENPEEFCSHDCELRDAAGLRSRGER